VRKSRRFINSFATVIILGVASFSAYAQTQLPADLIEKIDKVATDTLARTGVPSASIAIV
jgi:hypothetical protein